MVIKIYIDKPFAPDELSGQIDVEGLVFIAGSGKEEYLGWIDYEDGDVYNVADTLIGYRFSSQSASNIPASACNPSR